MGILQTLGEKPWEQGAGTLDRRATGARPMVKTRRAGLWLFLGVATMLFSLMVVAYAGRMGYSDWRPAPQIRLLWANTAMLMLSSAFLQWALTMARAARLDATRVGLLAAGVFTVVFLFGQVLAWRQLAAIVLGDFSNPAVGFFYMITGVHGAHMVGGLYVWARTTLRAWSAGADATSVRDSIANCAVYWHYLLGIWLVLFGLLFTGNNFELLLKFCGIK